MKYYLGFSIGLLYLLILSACTFNNPEEKYFEEVKQNLPKATISLADFIDKDTIYLFQATNLNYNISAPNLPITQVGVLVGANPIFSSSTLTGSFSIDGALLKTGNFELKIQIKSNSGTGSLADKNGLETVEIWKKWILVIDVEPPPTPTIQVLKENGFLKIGWTPFTKKNFKNYILTVTEGSFYKDYTITNPHQSFFIDSAYVGGAKVSYYVRIFTNLHSSFSSLKEVNYPQSLSSTYSAKDSTVILKWRKSNFEGTFKNVVIMENSTIRKVITDPRDTSFTLTLKEVLFGRKSTITLSINRKYFSASNSLSFIKIITIDNPTGANQIKRYQNLYYSKSMDKIIGFNQGIPILRIYNKSMNVVDSISINGGFSIPYPGTYVYYIINGGIAQQNLITKEIKTYLTKGSYGTYVTPWTISGTDNQLVYYRLIDNTKSNISIRDINSIININTGEVIYRDDYQISTSSLSEILSDDGQFRRLGTTVRTFDLSSSFSLSQSTFRFRPDNNYEMFDFNNPTTIISSKNGVVLRTLSPPVLGCSLINYDPATKNLFYKKDGVSEIYLINIETQKVTIINAWSSNCVYFIGGVLFDEFGYFKKIF